MTILRSGSSKDYSDNFEQAFGGKKSSKSTKKKTAAKKTAAKKPAAKRSTAKKAAAKKKSS